MKTRDVIGGLGSVVSIGQYGQMIKLSCADKDEGHSRAIINRDLPPIQLSLHRA